jgi:5-methylcytosine-specific restriction protein A
MLTSCRYCNKIHDTKHDCGKKPKRVKNSESHKFRSLRVWQKKREQIKSRDNFLCQVCIRKLHNTIKQYTYDTLSVHHIVPIEQDDSKKLSDSNLITLCEYHHEMAESGKISLQEMQEIAREQERRSTPKGSNLQI